MPPPPGARAPNRRSPPSGPTPLGHVTPIAAVPAAMTVGSFKEDHKLTEDETSFILKTTLLPEHREDPNVLRFISSYLRCRSTVQAEREAGLKARSGHNLRARPDIHAAITKLTEKSVMKYGFDASEVIERVKEIAGLDPIDLFNDDGTCKENMKDIPAEARRAIKSFKVKNLYETDPNGMPRLAGKIIEVQLWDKMKAQELLGREKDLFVEKKTIKHDVTENMANVLLDSTRRADQRLLSMGVTEAEYVDVSESADGKAES